MQPRIVRPVRLTTLMIRMRIGFLSDAGWRQACAPFWNAGLSIM